LGLTYDEVRKTYEDASTTLTEELNLPLRIEWLLR
jgi:hypothetical protein